MFKKLYDKCIDLAGHKSAKIYLGLISFIESSFFPIPPDVMIVPMSIAKKDKYLQIFFVATIFSVLGGLFGYFIGLSFGDLASNVVEFYNYESKVNSLKENLLNDNGIFAWLFILFLAGFTPLPYKVFTITSGLIGFNIFLFVLISLISRGLRFFLVSYLSAKYEEKFVVFFEKKGALWSTITGIIIAIILLYLYATLK